MNDPLNTLLSSPVLLLVLLLVAVVMSVLFVLKHKALEALEWHLQQTTDREKALDDENALQAQELAEWQQRWHELDAVSSKRQMQLENLHERLQAEQQSHQAVLAKYEQQQIHLSQLSKEATTFEITARENFEKWQETKQALKDLQVRCDGLSDKYHLLNQDYTELKTAQDERELSHRRQVEQFELQKAAMTEQFKLLANDILEVKAQALQENSKSSLAAVMTPFQQSIEGFKKEVQDIHHRETTQQGELRKELESLKELNHKITIEAHELSTALRGQKKLQGNWGELVLENVLDRSGLVKDKDYRREVALKDDSGQVYRPDVVINLPQGKHLIIDAKVSLEAYARYVNSETDLDRAAALKDHVKAMGDRINDLSSKDYHRLPELNSPDIVFMFVPIESAFVEALKADETLFQKAIEKHILVATPTTLLTSLNIVRQLWRYEDQNKHTAELARRAEQVYKKLHSFLNSFHSIKGALEKANESYVKAESQLLNGKGNLVKQVSDFKKLAPAIQAELSSYYVDKAELEIEYGADDVEEDDNDTDDLPTLDYDR